MRPHPRVVIIGAGFGGLQCAKALRGQPVDVVLVDVQNYHLFTPLLYQVASCLLAPSEITAPLRKVLSGAPNIRYRQGEVVDVDFAQQHVRLADGSVLEYEQVVLATGSTTNFYGNDAVESRALGLKTLGEALQLRNHVLDCLERAAAATDPDERERLLTFCIVGGGPTGVEYAGALAELARLVLPREYPEIRPHEFRIVLLEGGDRVLPMFKRRLAAYGQRELERRGVDVRTNVLVASANDMGVVTTDGTEIRTATLVWTAGVQPSAVPMHPGVTRTETRRIAVDDHLRILGVEHGFAIGDVAADPDRKGRTLPMLATPAMQAGRYVARQIVRGEPGRRFHYFNKGTMATIGRRAAVAQIGPIQLTGFLGWVTWLVVHLYYLIGFENRLRVLVRWSWYYIRLDRPVRSILRADPPRE
jgi:NADH dehydrogenase